MSLLLLIGGDTGSNPSSSDSGSGVDAATDRSLETAESSTGVDASTLSVQVSGSDTATDAESGSVNATGGGILVGQGIVGFISSGF